MMNNRPAMPRKGYEDILFIQPFSRFEEFPNNKLGAGEANIARKNSKSFQFLKTPGTSVSMASLPSLYFWEVFNK